MREFNFHTATDYSNKNAWGLYTSIDIFNCSVEKIIGEEFIRTYVKELCDILDVKTYGDPQMILFGGDPPDPRIYGWSISQMIETSLVSGHFIQAPRHAYIDIFSCKFYDARKAIEFSVNYFEGDHFNYKSTIRGDNESIDAALINHSALKVQRLAELG